MNNRLAIIIGCCAIAFSSASFSWSQWESCHEEAGFSDTYCSYCQCSDQGYGKNDCMSLSDYCEVFGNVGGR